MTDLKRLRRDTRATTPPRMRLTARDTAIIKAVAEFRVLRQDQIQTLFFGSHSTAQYRLSHLFQHGFLARQFLPVQSGRSPTLYVLDKRGAELLRLEYGYDYLPDKRDKLAAGAEFLTHTLAINDVRIAVTLACQAGGYSLLTWLGEAEMKATYERVDLRLSTGKRRSVSLIPDSYFVLDTPLGKAHFFLELDRGSMTVSRFQSKVLAYQAYVTSGAYQTRYNTRSLRVLTVTLGAKRLESLKHTTEEIGGERLFWFARLSDVTSQNVLKVPIWQVAKSTANHSLLR